MTTLQDAFLIPEDASALGFVVQLGGDASKADELVADYVLTPGVRDILPGIFTRLHHLFDQRHGEVGWFVHGSFGSGKSHFMALLSYLLENRDVAWAKPDDLIARLARDHRGWIAERRPLVVRENLLSAAKQGDRFDRLIYDAVNKALVAHGQSPFEFLHIDGVLDEARREGEQYGDAFWRNLERAGIVGGQRDFEEAAASPDLREGLARAFLAYKGRDVASAGFSPAWADGLRRLATHVKACDFGGIVLFLDEMLLWLSGQDGPAFKEAINQLNVIVDHDGPARDVPIALFVARQRRFSEFFPDLADEEQLHDHLDHHSGRFELITLEDVELRFIVRERILRESQPDLVRAAVDRIVTEQRSLLPVLLQSADEAYLRDVYPFHPALIEALIDISSLMQRQRTALRLLYELLRDHRDLPLGSFIPLGNAFDAIFPGADFSAGRKVERLRNIQRLYEQRIELALKEMAGRVGDERLTPERKRALDQLIKTALLAEASLRLRGTSRITVQRLVGLNDAEISGETSRGRIATSTADLAELARLVPAIQVGGSGATVEVGIVLEGVDLAEILDRARAQVDNPTRRLRTLYGALVPLLGLNDDAVFGPGRPNDGPVDVTWRGTRRRGTVSLGNVREMPYDHFRVRDGEFRVVIDYPWDELGHTVEEDRQRAAAFRKSEGSAHTIVWLPRHFNERETQILVDLAASEFIGSPDGRDALLGNLPLLERDRVVAQAAERARSMRAELETILRSAYKDHGEAVPLTSDVATTIPQPDLRGNLEHFARELLDRRFPQHPRFASEPSAKDLHVLLAWLAAAADTTDRRAAIDDATADVLRKVGEPLELCTIGQSAAGLRLDTRYIRDVLGRFQAESVTWAPIDLHLADSYGFQPALRNLFLRFVMQLHSYRAVHEVTGQSVDVEVASRPLSGLRLERARVLELAEWSRVRELGAALFALSPPQAQPTLAAQDAWAAELRRAGHDRRQQLQQLHELLAALAPPEADRSAEVRDALKRLAPLDDTRLDPFQTLSALIAEWPPDAGDPLREVVRTAPAALAAAQSVDRTARSHLHDARTHPMFGPEAADLLADLTRRLADRHLRSPLSAADIQTWNRAAHDLVGRMVRTPDPAPTTTPHDPRGVARHMVWERRRVRTADHDALAADLDALAQTIAALGGDGDTVEVDVTVHVRPKVGA